MTDYSNVPTNDSRKYLANISDAILNYQWWGHMGSNFSIVVVINAELSDIMIFLWITTL